MTLVESAAAAVARLDFDEVQRQYFFQDEAVVVDSFIPEAELAPIVGELNGLRSEMHRSHVPGIKKSSSSIFIKSIFGKSRLVFNIQFTLALM